MRELRILQYNVNHGKEATLASLLRDPACNELDILAIQEPWRNPFVTTGYNPPTSGFHLAYPPYPLARVCFYINKRLDPATWDVTYHNEDAQTVTIRYGPIQATTIQIHNIYNPSPTSYTSREPGTIATLSNILETSTAETEHVVVGDFNLHHPMWSSIERLTRHEAADLLLETAGKHALQLATPKGTITWRARGTQSTIDLSFLSQTLETRLTKCLPRPDLTQLSDHIPIETTLSIHPQLFVADRKRSWKKMDVERLREELKDKVPNLPVNTDEQIDARICELTRAITDAVDKSTPWARVGTVSKDYWTEECDVTTREARRAFHEMVRDPTAYTELRYHHARNQKVTTIRKAQRDGFRTRIAETIEKGQGLGRLMKWAKERAASPKTLPQLPPLVVNNPTGSQPRVAITPLEKTQALRDHFFPPAIEADLSDINNSIYPPPIDIPEEISEQELQDALQWVAKDKAPGPDRIPNRVLKAAQEWLTPRLLIIFNAALRNGYHPNEWKRATTLALRKPNKGDYTLPKAYRPIALLNTMGKLLERVMARKITQLAEAHGLLPESQMGARPGRSAETALQIITESIHTIWGLPGPQQVATLLSLDISGAFDHVSHERLLHNLRKRKLPPVITRWVASFLQNRRTKIKLPEGESDWLQTDSGIPQGSPISPILFLFFIADLLDTVDNGALRVSAVGFVDDINILTYGSSTERNCRVLSETHKKCLRWAETHGAKFAPEKYEVIHLTKAKKKFNLNIAPIIEGIQIDTKNHVRILGVQIDTKLRWGKHIAVVKEKAASLLLATGRIGASTWGASLAKSTLIYSTMVKPAILYGAGIWYSPQGTASARKPVDRQLEVTQNQFLRKAIGAYRAVNARILEKEADIPPITIELEKLAAKAVRRAYTSIGGRQIQRACEKIRNQALPGRTRPRGNPTPLQQKKQWLNTKISTEIWLSQDIADARGRGWVRPVAWEKELKRIKDQSWDRQWTKYLQALPADRTRTPAQQDTRCNRSQLHKGLSKAMSAIITQIRTEKIGLNAFLVERKVPGYTAPCPCGWPRQTAKHVILYCPQQDQDREVLYQRAGTRNYQQMLVTPQGAKAAAIFLQATNLLPQFQLGLN